MPLHSHIEPLSLLRKSLTATCLFVIASLFFMAYLLCTPTGLKATLTFFSHWGPYEWEAEKVEGSLFKPLTFQKVTFQGPDFRCHAETCTVILRFPRLMPSLDKVSLEKATITFFKSPEILTKPQDALGPLTQSLPKTSPFLGLRTLTLNQSILEWPDGKHDVKNLVWKSSHAPYLPELSYQGTYGTLKTHSHRHHTTLEWDLHLPSFLSFTDLHSQGTLKWPNRDPFSPKTTFQSTLEVKKWEHNHMTLENSLVQIKGDLANHTISFHSRYQESPLSFLLKGKATTPRWEGTLQNIHFEHPEWGPLLTGLEGTFSYPWHKSLIIDLLTSQKAPPLHVHCELTPRAPYSLSGYIHLPTTPLHHFAKWVPDLTAWQGQMEGHLQWQGTKEHWQYDGQWSIKEASLKTPFGVSSHIDVLNAYLKENSFHLEGRGRMGTGAFTLTGQGLLNESSPVFELHLQGKNLLLSDTSDYHITATPDITFTWKEGLGYLEGEMHIPRATIHTLTDPVPLTLSPDVVIVNAPKETPSASHPLLSRLSTHLKISLGDQVSYRGSGLHTRIKGMVVLSQKPNTPLYAQGKMHFLEGKYHAYGNTFQIREGHILFSGGPLTEPIFNVRAERTLKKAVSLSGLSKEQPSVTVGVTMTGHPNTIKMGFYSTPQMSEADIISYLLIGEPLSQTNDAMQMSLLIPAVSQLTSLLGSSRRDAFQQLAEKLRFDQFGFVKAPLSSSTRNPLENTVFVLGKQLSDRLYLHYASSLLRSANAVRENTVSLRYLMGKHITLEAETGTQGSSADVLFSFEGR